jgi:hypothetical protein
MAAEQKKAAIDHPNRKAVAAELLRRAGMVGLYETVIDALSTRSAGAHEIRPKVVASTATVRRAEKQIMALFTRQEVEIFPPPGPDLRDSYFAKTVPASMRASGRCGAASTRGSRLTPR